jgi:hypothetical protein
VQAAFDHWRPIYNTQRPHEALSLETPLRRYRPSQREYPESLPPVEYAPGTEVRIVDFNGRITYRGQRWKIGRAFIGQRVGLRPTEVDGVVEVLFLAHPIKELDLREQPIPSP